MSIGLEDISISKEDTGDSVSGITNKRIIFAHEAVGGETSIDLTTMTTPPSYASNGFVNASPSEIAAARLYFFKKRLTLVSNLNGVLVQHDSYVITSSTGIQLIGSYLPTGLDAGEVIVGYIDQYDQIVVPENKLVRQTYPVIPGQTTINLGMTYKVGIGLDTGSQIGALRVTRLGKTIYRTIGNVTAAEGNYTEVDSGSGYGTILELEVAPAVPEIIDVELGTVIPSGDLEIFSAIETLSGAVTKIAEDSAEFFFGEADPSRYVASTPNEVERRAFGDKLSAVETKQELYDTSSTLSEYTKTKWMRKNLTVAKTTAVVVTELSFNNLTVGKTYRSSGILQKHPTGLSSSTNMNMKIHDGAGNEYMPTCDTSVNVNVAVQSRNTHSPSFVFTATSASFVTEITTISLAVLAIGSFIVLEELPNHVETTQWT